MKSAALLALAALALADPVFAQAGHQHDDDHAGHDGHGDASERETRERGTGVPAEAAPEPPTDHAADGVFSPAEMDAARAQLRREHGGARVAALMLNLAEYQVRSRRDGFRWDGEGWFGGDLHRLVVKTEGELTVGDEVDEAESQIVYSRAISPYFDLQAGVRYDFAPHPTHVYGTIGFEGLAPYWFELDGALFLSERADVLARLEGHYDQLLTQHLILQPRAELQVSAQDVPEHEIGAGLSEFELELRLRYEIRREFAPYIGVSWQRKTGDTAKFARRDGERESSTSFVLGVRAWF